MSHQITGGYNFRHDEFFARCSCGWIRYCPNEEPLLNVALHHQITASLVERLNSGDALRSNRRGGEVKS